MKTKQTIQGFGEYNIKLPTSWLEVNPRELKILCSRLVEGGVPEHVYMISMLAITRIRVVSAPNNRLVLMSLPGRFFRRRRWVDVQQLHAAAGTLSFVTRPIPAMCQLPKCLGKHSMHQSLYGVPLIHYFALENAYQAFLSTQDPKWLRYLAVYVYWGDHPFNDGLTRRRARSFRWVSRWLLYAVMLWFSSVKFQLAGRYPHLFKHSDSSDDELESQPFDMAAMIRAMILTLNRGDATKNAEILQLPVNDALMQLDAAAKEMADLEKYRKK